MPRASLASRPLRWVDPRAISACVRLILAGWAVTACPPSTRAQTRPAGPVPLGAGWPKPAATSPKPADAAPLIAEPTVLPGLPSVVLPTGVPLSRLGDAGLAAVAARLRRDVRDKLLNQPSLLPDGTFGAMPEAMRRSYILDAYVHTAEFQKQLGELHGAAFPIALSANDHERLRDALADDPTHLSTSAGFGSVEPRKVAAANLTDDEYARIVQLLREVNLAQKYRLSDENRREAAGPPTLASRKRLLTEWTRREGFATELRKVGIVLSDLDSPTARDVVEGAIATVLREFAAASGEPIVTSERRARIEEHLRAWDDFLRTTASPVAGRLLTREERRAAMSAYVRETSRDGFANFLKRTFGNDVGGPSAADLGSLDAMIAQLAARTSSIPAPSLDGCPHDHRLSGACLVGPNLCQAPARARRCCRLCPPGA